MKSFIVPGTLDKEEHERVKAAKKQKTDLKQRKKSDAVLLWEAVWRLWKCIRDAYKEEISGVSQYDVPTPPSPSQSASQVEVPGTGSSPVARGKHASLDFVAIDFETANRSANSACAIGIAVVKDGRVTETRHELIRPPELLRFEPYFIKLHGITPQLVKDAPTLSDLWPSIWPLMQNQLLVAHNASFDMKVLRDSLLVHSSPIPDLQFLCSLDVARKAWPSRQTHKLRSLATSLDIELAHHNPASDAKAASLIMLQIASEHSINCPFQLAHFFGVRIRRISQNPTPNSSTPLKPAAIENLIYLSLSDPDANAHVLFRKNVAFTGTFEHLTQREFGEVVKRFGGIPKGNVNPKTDILVTGTQDPRRLAAGETESEKLRLARCLQSSGSPIQIIPYEDFLKLLQGTEE